MASNTFSFAALWKLAEQNRLVLRPDDDAFVIVLPEPDFSDLNIADLYSKGLIEAGVLKNVELPHEEVERAKAEGISEQSIQVAELAVRAVDAGSRAFLLTGSAALRAFWGAKEAGWWSKVPCEIVEKA